MWLLKDLKLSRTARVPQSAVCKETPGLLPAQQYASGGRKAEWQPVTEPFVNPKVGENRSRFPRKAVLSNISHFYF